MVIFLFILHTRKIQTLLTQKEAMESETSHKTKCSKGSSAKVDNKHVIVDCETN